MDKIVCLDKDYKIHKVYNDLDSLLKEIKGSKTQAKSALDDPTLSFRGYKLVEQEKLPAVYAKLYQEKVESLINEYGQTIEELETKVKDSTKKERKAKFRVDELEDDYLTKFKLSKDNYDSELNKLKEKHAYEQDTLDKTYKQYITELKSQHTESVSDLKNQAATSEKDIIAKYKEHVDALTLTIENYKQEVANQTREHEKSVKELHNAYETKVEKLINNVVEITDYLENNNNILLNRVTALMEVMTKMVEGDKRVYVLDADKAPLLKEKVSKVDVKSPNHYNIEKDNSSIDLNNYLPKGVKKIEDVAPKNLPTEPKQLKEKELVEKTFPKVEVVLPVQPKVNEEPVKTAPKEVEQPVVVKGITLKTKGTYSNLSATVKGMYLSDLMIKGLTISDLSYFGNVTEDIKGDVANVIVSELVAQNKTFAEYKDYLNHLDIDAVLNTLNLGQKEVDAFLEKEEPKTELKDVAPKNTEDFASEKKTASENSLPTNAINFNWGKYIDRITQNVDMEELLDKETLTMRDLQEVISVPSKQILGMLGVLKNLGYAKDFSNDRVVSRMEAILLIVVASSHTSQQGKESLEELINKLYPSWVQYRKRNNL